MNAPIPSLIQLEAAARAAGQRVRSRGWRTPDRKLWSGAASIALAAHAGVLGAVLLLARGTNPPPPEPVVLVELPAEAAPSPQSQLSPVQSAQPAVARSVPQVQPARQPTPVPIVDAPLPRDPVVLPPPAPAQPTRAVAPSVQSAPAASAPITNPVNSARGSNTSPDASDDPKAQKAESDYKSLVGSYIRRNKFSPPQARKAGISGDTKLRFVVRRDGTIAQVSLVGSSGSGLLDGEAAQFLQRLSPVPSFPRDLRKSEIPLTITLKFAVESK